MFTGITGQSGALVTTVVALTGAAILHGGAAAADPNQDDQFLALLEQEEIPALSNVPSLIVKAHQDCRQLDRGMTVDALVEEMTNDAYGVDPSERQYPPDRLTRTMARFITAAVEAYCPYDKGKIASIVANPAMGSKLSLDRINGPAARQEPMGTGPVGLPHLLDGGVFVAGRYGPGPVLASLIGAVPAGVTPSDPPQIPAPPPPTAQPLAPPRPIAPPPPKKPPPAPQQPPPPPQQVEPPAIGPQPGGGDGGGNGGGGTGGGGGNGGGSTGGGPAEQSPAPPMPPGFVRLAP